MNINQEGLDLIKEFEGFRATSYLCPAGVLTIGYGSTGSRVKPGMTISKEKASQWLLEDCRKFEDVVEQKVKVPLTSNQFSALVSFVYNVGTNNFATSTLLKLLNQKKYVEACDQLDRWIKPPAATNGLVRRRNAEQKLFNKPDGALVDIGNIPKPVLTNRLRVTFNTVFKAKTIASANLSDKEKVAIPAGTELQFLACKQEKKHWLITFGSSDGDIKFAGKNTWYLWHEHFKFIDDTPETTPNKPKTLADKVAATCEERGYPLNENKWNLIGISGLAPKDNRGDAYTINIEADKWNDSVGVIAKDEDGDWEFKCIYKATTEPGNYYTYNPLNPKGAARLTLGFHDGLWTYGKHKGYEALVQAGKAKLVRDTNKNFSRDDAESYESGNGVNLHTTKTTNWVGSASPNTIGKWSAGCNVVYNPDEFKSLMALMKQSPQYKANRNCRFDYRLLWHEWLN